MSNLSLMRLAVGSVLVIVYQSHPAQAQAFDAAERCRAIPGLHRAAVEITSATLVDAAPPGTVRYNEYAQNTIPVALPAHCRIEGVINRRKGAGGVEYGIGFVLNLPDDWNGRFMFQGGGAYNGSIGEPRGLGVGGLDDPALAHGWAIIATDSGHKGAPFDTTFYCRCFFKTRISHNAALRRPAHIENAPKRSNVICRGMRTPDPPSRF